MAALARRSLFHAIQRVGNRANVPVMSRFIQIHAAEGQGRLAAAKRLSALVSREGSEFGLPMFGSVLRAVVALTKTHHLPAQQLQFVLQESRKSLLASGNRDASAWVQILLPLLQLASVRSYRNQDMISTLQLVSSTLCNDEVKLSLSSWDAVQCAAALLASGVSDSALLSSVLARVHATPHQQLYAMVADAHDCNGQSQSRLGVFVDVKWEMGSGALYRSFTKDNADPFFDRTAETQEQPAALQARVTAAPPMDGHDAMCMALAAATAQLPQLEATDALQAAAACSDLAAAITDPHHFPQGSKHAPSLRGLVFAAQAARQAAATSAVQGATGPLLAQSARRLEGYLHKHLLQSMHAFVGHTKEGVYSDSYAARVVWQLLQQLQQLPSMSTPRRGEAHSRLGRLLHAQRNWLPFQFNIWPPGFISRALAAVVSAGDLAPAVADVYAQSALHSLARHLAARDATAHKAGSGAVQTPLFGGVVHPALVLASVVALGPQAQGRLLQHVPNPTATAAASAHTGAAAGRISVDLMGELVRSCAAACTGTDMSVEAGKLSSMLGATARVLRWRLQSSVHTGSAWQQDMDTSSKVVPTHLQLNSQDAALCVLGFSSFLREQLADGGVYTYTAAASCLDGVLALHAWSVSQAAAHDTGHLPAAGSAAAELLQVCLTAQMHGLPPDAGLKRVHCDTVRAVSQWMQHSHATLTGPPRIALQAYMSAIAAVSVSRAPPALQKQHLAARSHAQACLTRLAK